MVASVSALSLGQEEYHLGLAREDYYTSGGEPPGRWHGRGCAALGVVGEVHGPKLSLLLRGFSADGSAALVQNAGSPARQPGWDVTFSAPKTVSVLWGLADADTRRAVQEAHDRAVAAALDYLEDEAGVTRRGACGAGRERAGLAVAVFQHGTSRSQDPQLHSHCLILNLGVREDGSTGTIESRPLYRHKMAAGAVYRAALAAELERGLGVVAERRKGWFEVAGVPVELAEALSQRRREIEAVLAERGLEGAKSAALAALETRSRKSVLPRAELFLRWAEVGAAHGFGPDQARELLGRSTDREPASELREVLTLAVERLSAHHSHFAAADLVRFAAEEAQGRGLDAGQIRRGVDGLLREELVRVGFARGEERYTTREMLALERVVVAQLIEEAGALVQVGLEGPELGEEALP
ncbi:MAG: relaxase domain-containing protein, partial [Gemmataceae bacterium]|nr:relaxase domain-containing protein [Gemmataceae bacterium]